jgi:lactoylglutathione lyase
MKLGYIILYVPDVRATVEFYEAAFGLKLRLAHENFYAEMETGATALAFCQEEFTPSAGMFRINRRDGQSPGAEIGLVVEDVPGSFSQAVAAGAESAVAPVTKPWGQTVAYVKDNNGFLVEICSPMHE